MSSCRNNLVSPFYPGLEESPSCTLHFSSPKCWSSKDCAEWTQPRLPSVCSACSFTRIHSHKLRVSLWLTFPLVKNILGNYLAWKFFGGQWLTHNHMERTICRQVLPLSLLVSRGSPSLVFHPKRPLQSGASTFCSSHAGKGETRRWIAQKCLFAVSSAIFTMPYASGEEERMEKKDKTT